MSAAVASAKPARRDRGGRWLVPVVLALPFLVTAAALRGTTVALQIFHGSDELSYQYPTILQFSRRLPLPDLHSYPAAQTPLFHLLMAYAGKVIGYQLWRLRLLEVGISYALALAVFALLYRRLRMERLQALALTLLFVLSPYVFGQSFRLVTDNLALLFSVLAVDRFERFRESNRLGPFLAGCGAVAAAILTRQSTAFLIGVAAVYALRPGAGLSGRERLLGRGAVAVSALPAGLLFLNWHGLVPVGGDPSSCGLCPAGRAGSGAHAGGLEVQTAELSLATIGLYGAVLFAPLLIARVRGHMTRSRRRDLLARSGRGPLAGAGAAGLLLLAFPASPGDHAAGDLWNVAARLPSVDGSSLLFWVLVPLSGALLWIRVRQAPRRWLVTVFAACFLISAVAIRYPWQKYVDPVALLILLLTVGREELGSPRKLAGAAVLALAFLAYALDFSSHRSVPHGASRPSLLVRLDPGQDGARPGIIRPVAYDEDLANRIRELVATEASVTEKRMFGGLAFLIGGNMSVSVSGQGGLLLRVDPAETKALLGKPFAQPFVMRGRSMDGWLRIDAEGVQTKRQLERWVARGVSCARSLPAKR